MRCSSPTAQQPDSFSSLSSNSTTVEKAFWLLLVSLTNATPHRPPPNSPSQHPSYFPGGSNLRVQLYGWLTYRCGHCPYLWLEYKLCEARGIIYFAHGFVLSDPQLSIKWGKRKLRELTAPSFYWMNAWRNGGTNECFGPPFCPPFSFFSSPTQHYLYSLCLSMWYNLVLCGPYPPDSDPGLSLLSGVCQIIISTQSLSLSSLSWTHCNSLYNLNELSQLKG